ncbi:MAG TPA: gluconate 2-dehydrogenase subunit 3 family protein [Actinomycetota bacterium]|nr:gluconate 2-dehydrogenase subunit 3 family protein [Actinomycetota bacterium]
MEIRPSDEPSGGSPQPEAVGRRQFLQGAGAFGLLALVPGPRLGRLMASAPAPGAAGRFLTAHELDTLRAVCRRLIPGPPDDPDPGADEAGVAEAIDLLLAAFSLHPPLIHAGGPFSDRAGASDDDFADFVLLDPHAELGWRIRIEGSLGLAEREFAGPVVGLQQTYREGLAHLDQQAQSHSGTPFVAAPGAAQDALLADPADADTQAFVAVAFANSLEAMYGPPEYGGNRGLVGWRYTRWPGDRQPRGYRDDEVTEKDPATQSQPAPATLPPLAPQLAPQPGARQSGQVWRGPSGRLRGR